MSTRIKRTARSGLITLALLPLLCGFAVNGRSEDTQQVLAAEARSRVQAFAAELKQALQQSIQSAGRPAAISTCKTAAPAIAAAHSKDGWHIGRTALRLRNPDNRPDVWETQVLQDFQQRMQQGEAAAGLESSQVDDGRFRYMKAIPLGPICAGCHGDNIDAAVRERLDRLYPQDNATGFALGSLRGAFTVSKKLPE